MSGIQCRCGGKADWGRTVLKLLLTEVSIGDTSKVIWYISLEAQSKITQNSLTRFQFNPGNKKEVSAR